MNNNFVINPQTGRPIKIGSALYNKLVRSKMVHGEAVKPKPKLSSIVKECKSNTEAVAAKKHLEATVPPPDGKRYAISHNRKDVLLRNKKMTHSNITRLVAEATRQAQLSLAKKQFGRGKTEPTEEDVEYMKNKILKKLTKMQAVDMSEQPKPQPKQQFKKQHSRKQVQYESEDDDDDYTETDYTESESDAPPPISRSKSISAPRMRVIDEQPIKATVTKKISRNNNIQYAESQSSSASEDDQ